MYLRTDEDITTMKTKFELSKKPDESLLDKQVLIANIKKYQRTRTIGI